MNPCIIVLTHPNTKEKEELLKECIKSIVGLDYSIFLFANMGIKNELLNGVTKFIQAGDNTLYSASDFLSLEAVTNARKRTKYRHHLNNITYLPINYGFEKSYYWACINLYKVAFDYVESLNYTHYMLIQYDSIINESDIHLVKKYMNEMIEQNLDGDFPVDANMGDSHLNGDVFFGKVSWWNELFKTMNPKEFYEMSFPNWTPEEYFYLKAEKKGGNIKIRLRKSDPQDPIPISDIYYNNIPDTWTKVIQICDTKSPINLYFPNVSMTGLASHLQSESFNIDKSLAISVMPIGNEFELFIYNRRISDDDKDINVDIKFINKETSYIITSCQVDISPGYWKKFIISENLEGHKLEVTTKYETKETKTYIV